MKFEVPYFGIELSIDPGSLPGVTSKSLQQMKIIPSDWQIQGEEFGPRLLSGFSFEEGVNVFVKEDSLVFSEALYDKSLAEMNVPKIIRSYAAAMPRLGYRSIDIQMMGHFRETEKFDSSFIVSSLHQSPWSKLGNLADAGLELKYDLGDCKCELSVKAMTYEDEGGSSIGVITFFADFKRSVKASSAKKRLRLINSVLDGIETDLNRYKEMAHQLMTNKENF